MNEADLEYQRLACRTVGLVHPHDREQYTDVVLELGTWKIIDSDAALEAVIDRYLSKLRTKTQHFEEAHRRKVKQINKDKEDGRSKRSERLRKRYAEVENSLREKAVLSVSDFLALAGKGDAERKRQTSWLEEQGAAKVRSFARQNLGDLELNGSFERSHSGYRQYLHRANPTLFDRLSGDLPALVPEEPRRTHSYIMSTTKTGKSELLKAHCLAYTQAPDYAGLVVIDPGGDMVPEMARWPELSERLVYIDPALDPVQMPIINPFDAEGLGDHDRGLLVEQIVAAIGTLFEGKFGGALSVNMQTVLISSIRLLVDLPNTDLRDLQALMRGDERLRELGRNSPRRSVSEFFASDFDLPTLSTTKNSIVVKLGNILERLDRVLCGPTSIDLERVLEERKFVLVNVAKGRLGTDGSAAVGTLLVSMLQAIAMKRERLRRDDRPMTHLIIDECQNFISSEIKTIIREARKFGLAVTLAQQEFLGDMPPDIGRVVAKTTNVKIAGRSDHSETGVTGELVGVSPADIAGLDAGQFYYRAGSKPAFLLRVRSDRLGYRGTVSGDDWNLILQHQIEHYYRDPGKKLAVAEQSSSNIQDTGEARQYDWDDDV